MRKRFNKKNLPKDLQQKYAEELKYDLQHVLDYMEIHYTDRAHYNSDIAILKACLLMHSALTIHIDNVLEFADEALKELENFKSEPAVFDTIFDIQKIRAKEARRRNKVAKWADKDISLLTLDQKKNAAYQLSSHHDEPTLKKAAELFYSVYKETNSLYEYCNYANVLYKSGQKEKALEEFEIILKFDQSVKLENHESHIATIFENLLDYYSQHKMKFYDTWNRAMSNIFIQNLEKKSEYVLFIFPLSYQGTENILQKAYEYKLWDICTYIKNKISRDNQKISARAKEILSSL